MTVIVFRKAEGRRFESARAHLNLSYSFLKKKPRKEERKHSQRNKEMIRTIGSYIDKFKNYSNILNKEMTYELLEALKREFWPGYKEENKQTSSVQEPKQEENLLEKDSAKEEHHEHKAEHKPEHKVEHKTEHTKKE